MTTPRVHQYARECGFSLVEALIALAIIATMTAVLVETATRSAITRAAVRERREALLIAQSALDNTYDPVSADNGSWRQYSWQITRQASGTSDPLDAHPLELMTVLVSTGERSNIVRLSTLRMRP
jgi:hypothetical protein